MNVRAVEPSDRASIIDLALESWPDAPFHAETPDLARLGKAADWFLASADTQGWILVDGAIVRGFIGVLLTTHMFSGQRLAIGWWWWVQPQARNGSGLVLLSEAEKWAKNVGASAIQLLAPTAPFRSLCERLDYTPVEMTYQKEL